MTDLDQLLTHLETTQLLRRLSEPDPAYMFKHVLTQETAYQSLLIRRRRMLHRLVAESYERLFADRLDEYAAILARHYGEAGDEAKMLDYALRAGDAAARVYANAEAIEHYTRALEVAKRLPVSDEQLIHLYTRRGRVFEVCGQYDHALANYEELARLAAERRAPALELAALLPQAAVHSTPTARWDVERGRALATRALQLARRLNDPRAEAKALWNLMLVAYNYTGEDPQQAVANGEASLAIARAYNLKEEMAYALHDLARPYVGVGRLDAAKASLAEAIGLWRELGNLPLLADSLTTYAIRDYLAGEFQTALTRFEEALEISRSIGSLWGQAYSMMYAGALYLDLGEVGRAIAALEDAIVWGEQANFIAASWIGEAILGYIHLLLGQRPQGINLLHKVVTAVDQHTAMRPILPALLALLDFHKGRLQAAYHHIAEAYQEFRQQSILVRDVDDLFFWLIGLEVSLSNRQYGWVLDRSSEAIATMRHMGARAFLADIIFFQGQALRGLGRVAEAYQTLHEARAEAEAVGSIRALWTLLPVLHNTAIEQGEEDAAAQVRQRAAEVIRFIANHIPQPDLRASFLALPQNRAMLDVP